MNIQQLETFIQVAENLNFARAAEVLHMTQSTVSRQIHALEEEIGVRLLLRTTRTVTLTATGISFLEDAKKIVNTMQVVTAKIRYNTQSSIQILSIGCVNEVDLFFLGNVLQQCKQQLPEVHPLLKIIPHRSILSLFSQGDLDVLFGFREDVPLKDGTIYHKLASIPLCCAISPLHPLAEKQTLPAEELYAENIILCNALPSRAAEYQQRIAAHIPPERTYISENLQAALALIRAGYGFAILPKIELRDNETIYVPIGDSEPISYGVFYKRDSLSPPLEKFISLVKMMTDKKQ